MDIQQLHDTLSAYSSGYARLWDFSPSHNRVVIELSDRDHRNIVYLILLGTMSIRVPTSWRIRDLRISRYDDGLLVRDEGVEIRFAYEAMVQDNYSP